MLPAGMNTAVDKSMLAPHRRRPPRRARRIHRALEGQAGAGEASGDGLRRQGRLGLRRTAGARLTDRRGQADPAVRPGHPARHLHPAARGGHRPHDRRRVHPASAAGRQLRRNTDRRQADGLRLGAVRVRRGRLRVRLLGRQPRRSGVVGGAVRRLRQRRAVDHRRVHLLRRGQVGSAVRRRAAAAARPRGPGSRPHVGPDRAVPAAVAPRAR